MSFVPYQCSRSLLESVLGSEEVGAYRFGIAEATPVDMPHRNIFDYWIDNELCGELAYMKNHRAIRFNPSLLLEDECDSKNTDGNNSRNNCAKSIIVCAFPYTRPSDVEWQPGALRIASYALGDDYHEVLRKRLAIAVSKMKEKLGGEYRICVDTAPLQERYWAVRSGLGYVGLNGMLMLPRAGSCFFIGSIITTVPFEPDEPLNFDCGSCRRCIACCPAAAIMDTPAELARHKTLVDARKCLSCLTIEKKGELPENINLGNRLYGCDTCLTACPHNRLTEAPAPLPEFRPREQLLSLTKEMIDRMTHEEYCLMFKGSAVKRAKLDGLKRNAAHNS